MVNGEVKPQTKTLRFFECFFAVSFVWIFSLPTSVNIIFSSVLSLVIAFMIYRRTFHLDYSYEANDASFIVCVVIGAVTSVLGYCFYKRWSNPDSIILVPNIIIQCNTLFFVAISVVVSIGAFNFLLGLARMQTESPRMESKPAPSYFDSSTIAQLIYLFLVAVLTISLCSKSSVLYLFNDAPDGNCFFTVGKAILKGKVLYRDIFEQKGPYIYFLHSISSFISESTFHGVYLIELVSCFFFLFYILHSVRLFNNNLSISVIALFAAFIYSQGGFFHGDEIEEFCLPIIALTNYYLLRYLSKHILIKPKELFVVGVFAGVIFWSKYTICGYFVC